MDLILDTAPANGMLPELVRIAGGDPRRVLTISDFAAASQLNVRTSFDADQERRLRYDVLGEYARRAADGKFTIPVAGAFPLEQWRTAAEISQSGRARGKIILIPIDPAAAR